MIQRPLEGPSSRWVTAQCTQPSHTSFVEHVARSLSLGKKRRGSERAEKEEQKSGRKENKSKPHCHGKLEPSLSTFLL